MSDTSKHPSEVAQRFGQTIKSILVDGKSTWLPEDSGEAGLALIRSLKTHNGHPVNLSESQATTVKSAFNPKRTQMSVIDNVLSEVGVSLEGEEREFVERLADPVAFRQELVSKRIIPPARKNRTDLGDLLK